MKQPLLALGLLLSATTFNAHASLTSYTGAGGAGLVYSSVSNVTWTQDANLLGTLETTLGYSNAINAIIAASPTINGTANYYDTPAFSGHHSVTASDFAAGGLTSWFGAQAFVGYLNSISYGGSNQWRLPTAASITQHGFNVTDGELGQLYYSELNKLAFPGAGIGCSDGAWCDSTIFDWGLLGNGYSGLGTSGTAGLFSNAQVDTYWSGTEYAPIPSSAWGFGTGYGNQDLNNLYDQLYAWAVSPGQVSAVPVPGAVWLMGSGLLGLLSLKRRGHAEQFALLVG